MKYRKTKISLSILTLLTIISYFSTRKPATFTAISYHGKEIHCERSSVTVPEVREDPNSNRIEVEYVRLKSFSKNPQTPIFFLAGGPGQDATSQAENVGYLEYWSSFLETRDVVLIDQRGVGKLKMWWINLGWPPSDILVKEEAALAHFTEMSTKATRAFKRRGIDLNGYNSKESAHDIDTVRDQLGYEKIIPFGFSYGTHLAQSYIKYHNARVDKTILIGAEGLEHTFKFPNDLDNHYKKIAAIVEADSILGQTIPDFVGLYQKASQKLSANPIEIEISTPIKLKRTVKVGKFGLDYILKRDLGDANDIVYFPRLLHSIAYGDGSALKYYVEKRYKDFFGIPAMMVSMDLASGASQERIASIRAQEKESMFGKAANLPFVDLLNQWPVKDLGNEFRTLVQSDAPALLLSGSLDINTPAYQADIIQTGFPNSTHLVVENAGHEQIQHHKDMTPTILEFIDGKDVSEKKLSYPSLQFKPLFN